MADCPPPAPAPPARRGRAVSWVIVIAALYLIGLWYVDRDRDILSRLAEMALPLAGCALLVLASYVVRYQRWRAVLAKQGCPVSSWAHGFAAYLAGFAFTASPGKAGELLRIRYFNWQNVPTRATLTAFIFERAIDLLVITLMGAGAASLVPVFGLLASIIFIVLLVLLALGCWPPLARAVRDLVDRLPGAAVRRLGNFLVDGAEHLGPLVRLPVIAPATALGTLAWTLTAAAFALLCHAAGIDLPWPLALGIYPLAMLIGALSFVPGGVGTTEAAVVIMLGAAGVPADTGLAVAIGIRLVSLWLAVAVGMLAMGVLELLGPGPRDH